jgi:branched-chain amino acid transport system permease protein
MNQIIQLLFNGLTLGAIYGLVALGLTLVYGVLHIPNFAHGALYMVGGYVAYTLVNKLGLEYWWAMLGAGAVVALLAMLMQALVFVPLRKAPELYDMIGAIGVMLFLEATAQFIWGADFHRLPTPYGQVLEIAGMPFPLQRLLIVVAALFLVVLLHLFLTRSVTGSTIMAMAQEPQGAALVGIDARRVTYLVFAISGVLAAVAATLYAPINLLYPTMGNLVIVKAFVIIILGGMGSFPGAILGGLIIGMAESFGGFYVSSDYKDIIAFVLLVAILSVRPQGLLTHGLRGA